MIRVHVHKTDISNCPSRILLPIPHSLPLVSIHPTSSSSSPPPPPLSPWSTHLVGTAATSGRTLLRCQALPARPLAPETRLTPPPLQATSTLLAANIPETGQRSQVKSGRSRGRTIIYQGSKVVNHVSSADRPACSLRNRMHSGPVQN